MRTIISILAAAVSVAALARTVTDLSGGGWTFDGMPVSVPHTWNADDAADGKGRRHERNFGDSVGSPSYARGPHVYARALPDPKPGKRFFLRCHGVSVKAEVTVNGARIGEHFGAFTAFTFEITEALKQSGNVLEITADNSYDLNVPPVSGDFSMYGGVYRPVELIETDLVCIDPRWHGTDAVILEADPATGRVRAKVGVDENRKVTVWRDFTYDFGKVEKWTPENPKLYEVKIDIGSDSVTRKVGFRTVEWKGDGFYLNGQRRQIHGVCRHQDRYGKGWAVTKEDEREDVAWMKKMGADGVRTAHYPQSSYLFDLCDERGIMVWTELPLVEMLTFTPAFRRHAIQMAEEMVAQHRNHPSVILWGLFNEIFGACGGGMPEEKTLALLKDIEGTIHAADPSRKTVSASYLFDRTKLNSLTDLQGFNLYPGWYFGSVGEASMKRMIDEAFEKTPARQIAAISEYGAGASVAQHADPVWQPIPNEGEYPEEYQALLHAGALKAIAQDARVWGAFPWVMFDLGADVRREADRHGINDKGLVTHDRKTAKDAFYLYKANWNSEPLLHLVGRRMTEVRRSTMNVLAFSNVGAVELKVNGKVVARKTPDAVRTVLFEDVPIDEGENRIEVCAGGLTETARWTRKPPFSSLRLWWPEIERQWTNAWPVIRRNRGVFDEIWFSGGHIEPLERHEVRAKWMADAAAEVRAAGMAASIEFELTIGNEDPCDGKKPSFRNWQGFVGPEGRVGVRCNCPRDPAFHAYFREVLRRYLVFQPDTVWLDDDVRITHHGRNSWGCFCDRCLGEFSKSEGKTWTREALVAAMQGDAALKERFVDHCNIGLGVFAEAFTRAVKEFSPRSRTGLQYAFNDRGQLRIIEGMRRGNGGERIEIRPGCCAYNDDIMRTVDKTWRIGSQMKTLNALGDAYSRWCPEIETYPRVFGTRSAKGLVFEPLLHLSTGMDTLSWYVMSQDEKPEWFDGTVLAGLRRNVALYRAYVKASEGSEPIGFGCLEIPFNKFGWYPFPVSAAATGIPFNFGPGRTLGFALSGAEGVNDAPLATLKKALSGAIVCDMAAARALVARGLVDPAAAELGTRELTDSVQREGKVTKTAEGGGIAVFPALSPQARNSRQVVAFSMLADDATGGKLPVVWQEAAMCVTIPRVRKDGTLATVVFLNTRIDAQPPAKVILRNFRGRRAWFYPLDGEPVSLAVERETSGDALVRLPSLGAWSGGFLAGEMMICQ